MKEMEIGREIQKTQKENVKLSWEKERKEENAVNSNSCTVISLAIARDNTYKKIELWKGLTVSHSFAKWDYEIYLSCQLQDPEQKEK